MTRPVLAAWLGVGGLWFTHLLWGVKKYADGWHDGHAETLALLAETERKVRR